jgi:hypothetical protein
VARDCPHATAGTSPPCDCRDPSPLRVRVALYPLRDSWFRYPLRVLVALYTLHDCWVMCPLRVRVALHPLRDC